MRGWFPRHCAVEVYSQHEGEETELFTGRNMNFSALYNLRPQGPLKQWSQMVVHILRICAFLSVGHFHWSLYYLHGN